MIALSASATFAQANSKYAGIVIDANTGKTLYSYKADEKRYPASLTKMMTVYMMFDAMQRGKMSNSTRIKMSSYAASMVPSKLGIRAGGSISAEDAVLALVTKSANDVAAAVAEHIGGSERKFADMMTQKARQLGMTNTTFRNASGLPNSAQTTTARDMARLGIALQEHFPRQFKVFKTRSFRYGKANHSNHNRLLGRVKGVDGIKTGYTRASGFNLVSSVNTGGRSIVAVVMGGRTGASRNAQMEKLIAEYLNKGSKRDNGPILASYSGKFNKPASASLASMPLSDLPIPDSLDRSEPTALAYAPSKKPKAREAIDPITTASSSDRSGWIIQIASLPTQNEAIEYLDTANSKAASVLKSREPFVEVFKKGGATYHRARFAGFGSKSEAWAACKALKKYNYACLAQKI